VPCNSERTLSAAKGESKNLHFDFLVMGGIARLSTLRAARHRHPPTSNRCSRREQMKIAPDEIRGSRTPTPPPSRRAGMIHPYISRIEIDLMGRLPVTIRLSSSPGEFHPEALTEPCLNLSIHTALHSRSLSLARASRLWRLRLLLVAQLAKPSIELCHPLRSPSVTDASTLLQDDPPSSSASIFPFRGSHL